MTQGGWDENEGSGKSKQRGGETPENKESRGAGIDVHVGIQKRRFLNAELNDITEAHGDFRLFAETFHQ